MSCFLYIEDKEASHKINIDELYENRKRRDLRQLNIFDKILNRIHKRITFTGRNKKNDKHIWFNIPEFIFGEPTYDKGDCIGYIVAKLEDNGFYVRYLHPNNLFISWNEWIPSYVRTEFKKKTGILIDEKGNVIEQKKKTMKSQCRLIPIIYIIPRNNRRIRKTIHRLTNTNPPVI